MKIKNNTILKLFFLIFLSSILLMKVSPSFSKNFQENFFNLDTGADIFNQPLSQFNVLEIEYSKVQTAKNIELVKKELLEHKDNPMIAYETIARFIRAESYDFTDLERSFESLVILDSNLNKIRALKKVEVADTNDTDDTKENTKSNVSLNKAIDIYQLLINTSRIVLKSDYSDINKEIIKKEKNRILPLTSQAWHLILRLLIESAVPGTGDHQISAQRLLNIKSGNPHIHFAQANAFLLAGQMCNCEKTSMLAPRSFEISLILTSGDERLLDRIANILIAILEHNDENNIHTPLWLTEYSYKKLIQQDPENPISLNNLGYFYATYNIKLDEALENCLKAVEIDPVNPYFLDSLGWVYFRKGDFKKAILNLEKAKKINPDIAEIRAHLANVYYSNKNFDSAVNELKDLIKIEPNNIAARNNLGYILTDNDMDLNLAYEHLKYAINNKPDDPSYNDSMGWFYYKTGHFNLSRKYLSKALQIKPDMAEPLLHLAKLELHESNIDKALEKSIDALKINPETEGLVSFIGFVTAAKTINMELKKIEELKTQSVQSLNKKFSLSSSLARLYYTNGFLLKSKEIYLKLLDIIPDKTLFLKKIEEIDALIAGKISFTGNAELITHKKPLPDYLNKIPDQSIQFSIFNNSLINRIFEFSYNNFELLKIFNKNIFFELKPELILQYIIPDSSNNKIELVFIAEYKNSKNINSNLKNLINVFNFISKNQRIHTLENPEDMPLWTVIFFNRTFYISFVNNKLFITSSKKLLNEFTMNTLNFKSIKNSSEFVTLWNKNKAPEFHAIFYSNKIFFEKLFEKIPALNSVNNFSNLKNIKNCLEKIYFKNANTLDEYYSIETSDSETSNKIGDFLNNMINMSKSLYESKIIKINPLIETEDKFVTAHIEVNGFLGMKDFLSKHIFKNKPFIKKIIKLIKFKK